MVILAQIIHYVIWALILLVIAQAVLSYFMDPYDPIRQRVDRMVAPFLEPIRRVVPPVGRFDFSPIVLIILLQLIDILISRLLLSL
jgi:YggT family protein